VDKLQTQALLTLVSTFDQRIVTEETVAAWSVVFRDVDYDLATKGVIKHFAGSNTYLMPAHVMEQVATLVKAMKEDERSEDGWKSDPCPLCIHDIAIVRCDECCATLADEVSNLTGQRLFTWVDENLLKALA